MENVVVNNETINDETIDEYNSHPSIEMIKLYYENDIKNFDFQTVDADTVMLMIKNLDSKKSNWLW